MKTLKIIHLLQFQPSFAVGGLQRSAKVTSNLQSRAWNNMYNSMYIWKYLHIFYCSLSRTTRPHGWKEAHQFSWFVSVDFSRHKVGSWATKWSTNFQKKTMYMWCICQWCLLVLHSWIRIQNRFAQRTGTVRSAQPTRTMGMCDRVVHGEVHHDESIKTWSFTFLHIAWTYMNRK